MTKIISPTHLVLNNTNYYLRPMKGSDYLHYVYKEDSILYPTMHNNWNEYLEKTDFTSQTSLPRRASSIALAYHSYINPERFL